MLILPQTSIPIKVFFQQLFMTSPSEVEPTERKKLSNYQWQLNTIQGVEIEFSHSKEKVVLLNLWATWCPPCLAELPSMQNLYDTYGERMDFYFVSAEDPKTISKFIEKKGYTFPVYIETQRPPAELQVSTIPTTFLIDASGEIIIQKTGAAQWDSAEVKTIIEELLAASEEI